MFLFVLFLFFWGVGVWGKRGLEGSLSFVVVCCFVCQRCFVWALMPVSSKALLPQDMQLEIDRWVDRERQTASDTGTDCREAKGTLYIMPMPSKILFYLQKLFRNGEKRPFPPLTSLQRRCFINHYHGAGLNHFLYMWGTMLPFIFRPKEIKSDATVFADTMDKEL